MIGQILDGRYKIIRELSAGGFGHTYIAEDIKSSDNFQYVVKQLKPRASDSHTLQIARRLFKLEGRVLKLLGRDPQIPTLFAYIEEDLEFYLVQEFIEGHTLTQEFSSSKFSENKVIELLQDILTTLAFVHQHKVIHRDIKPDNLIRRKKDGKIVLIDFGAVKELTITEVNSQGQTILTVAIGTPAYMPIEQAMGKPKFSSDIYAVGLVAIQALTGIMPHNLQQDFDTGEINWHNGIQVSPGLATILDKMIMLNFLERYPSAIEALQAIEELVGGNPNPIPKRYKPSRRFTKLGNLLDSFMDEAEFFLKEKKSQSKWSFLLDWSFFIFLLVLLLISIIYFILT